MRNSKKIFLLASALSVAAIAGGVNYSVNASATEIKPDKTAYSTSAFTFETGASIRLDTVNTGADNTTGIRFIANVGKELRDAVLENGEYKDGYEVGMAIVPAQYFSDYENQKGENGYNDYFEYFEEVKGKSKSLISTQYTADELVSANSDTVDLKVVIIKLHDNNYNIPFQAISYYFDGENYYYSPVSVSRTVSFVASAALEDMQDDATIDADDKKALSNILTKAAVLRNDWSFNGESIATIEVDMGGTLNLKETFGKQIYADDLTFTVKSGNATITDGVLTSNKSGNVVVTATAFGGLYNVDIPVRFKGIPVANTPAELSVLTNTGVLGSDAIAISKVGEYKDVENVSAITWNTNDATYNSYPIRIVGVDKDWAAAQGVKSIKLNVWMESGSGLTVFNYPGNDSKNSKGATLTLTNDVSNAVSWLTLLDAQGKKLTQKAPYGEWVTVIIDTTIAGTLAGDTANLNIAFRAEPGKSVYFADVEFLNVKPTDDVNYTVEHYKQTAGAYVLDESLTETLGAKLGTTVTATYKDVDGYLPFSASATVSSGMVTLDGLTLKLYYNEAVKVANTDGKGYIYSISNTANFGDGGLTIEKQAQEVAGVENSYKLTSTRATAPRIVGVDKTYTESKGYTTFKFSMYLESFDDKNRPYIQIVNTSGQYVTITDASTGNARKAFYFTRQRDMKDAEDYVRIYNEDGVRMASVVAKQWCVVEVDITKFGGKDNYPRIHVELFTTTDSSYSYYIANATLSTDAFNKADSPLAVTYNGERVGAMVSYQAQKADGKGVGNSGLISSEYGMRLTQTAEAGKDCVKVEMCSASTRNTWLMLKGLSSADITSKGITKLTFDYYIKSTAGNPLMRMYDTSVTRKFYISPWQKVDTDLVKVNGAQTTVPVGTWCKVEITLSNVGDWRGSLWAGLDLQLGADSGSFYVANFVLS